MYLCYALASNTVIFCLRKESGSAATALRLAARQLRSFSRTRGVMIDRRPRSYGVGGRVEVLKHHDRALGDPQPQPLHRNQGCRTDRGSGSRQGQIGRFGSDATRASYRPVEHITGEQSHVLQNLLLDNQCRRGWLEVTVAGRQVRPLPLTGVFMGAAIHDSYWPRRHLVWYGCSTARRRQVRRLGLEQNALDPIKTRRRRDDDYRTTRPDNH
jgi:hypothetical protein